MASLSNGIIIKYELRPCYVDGEIEALFHKWVDRSHIVPPSPLVGGHSGGVLKYTLALIEYPDGRLAEVKPSQIRFIDNKIDEYAFCTGNENEHNI